MSSCAILAISCLIVLLSFGFSYADQPSDIEKCRAGDVDCIAKIIPLIFRRYPHGGADFGLPDLEKIQLQNVPISNSTGKESITMDLIFKVMNLHGISNLTVDHVVGFETDPSKSKFEVYCTVPELVLNGQYKASGKVLVLPINGEGFGEIRLKNAKLSVKLKMQDYQRDGKLYLKVKTIKGKIEPELMHVMFENLFKGNPEVSNSINDIINSNWKNVWDDLQSEINKALVRIVSELLEYVLKSLSYDDFYKKD